MANKTKMKTRFIGERFQHKNKTFEVVQCNTCKGCYFDRGRDCYSPMETGACSKLVREDKTSVIFKHIKQNESGKKRKGGSAL